MKSATLNCNLLIYIYEYYIVQIKKETANIWEYNIGNNVNIVYL